MPQHLSYAERLRGLGLFSLEKKWLQKGLITAFQHINEVYEKDGERFFIKTCSDRIRGNHFKLNEVRLRLHIRKIFFYSEDGETLEQVTQRSSGCPIIGSVQGQVGWGLEQPDLVKDVPGHGQGLNWMIF